MRLVNKTFSESVKSIFFNNIQSEYHLLSKVVRHLKKQGSRVHLIYKSNSLPHIQLINTDYYAMYVLVKR